MTGPLDGVLVADFSRVLAGPLASAMLADLGATVVKVERPGTGDDTRSWGPPWVDQPGGTASYFHAANRSKRSVTLDLADPVDRDLAARLAARADVLVENFKSGTLARHGLGYDQVAATNPGVVYCSVTGFGSAGGADLPGYDFLVQAVGGLMSITGAADAEPTKVGVAVVDVLTSKDATIGILAALRARDVTGHGQHVEVNLLSSLLGSLANQASSYLLTGQAPDRMGNAHPSIAPYQLLRCSDTQLAVACGNDGQFGRLAAAIDAPVLALDRRFATNAARVENRPQLVAALEARLTTASAEHWASVLTDVGVPAGKVGDLGDAIALAERLGLEPTVAVGAGAPAQVRHPVTYSRTPVTDYRPPPRLGQHDQEVRCWLADHPKENLT
ncbi:CoA transferase [Mumia zhuanghuii]|uniref:CaiB/BaiF CoA transferase family protein n=2 Tax=Mumia TaxID=1546255 RepID=A0ABW1QK04_9ACTN|nr:MULTISPECIES: CaiB/BaiF CoA-transferase family protein [Mumia]KAA1418225.1 CoA transferase [Mumia zhuanghuii]